jgi:hypothetical protein
MEKLIITLVFEKNANFAAENWRKSPKIVIIALTPVRNGDSHNTHLAELDLSGNLVMLVVGKRVSRCRRPSLRPRAGGHFAAERTRIRGAFTRTE